MYNVYLDFGTVFLLKIKQNELIMKSENEGNGFQEQVAYKHMAHLKLLFTKAPDKLFLTIIVSFSDGSHFDTLISQEY